MWNRGSTDDEYGVRLQCENLHNECFSIFTNQAKGKESHAKLKKASQQNVEEEYAGCNCQVLSWAEGHWAAMLNKKWYAIQNLLSGENKSCEVQGYLHKQKYGMY